MITDRNLELIRGMSKTDLDMARVYVGGFIAGLSNFEKIERQSLDQKREDLVFHLSESVSVAIEGPRYRNAINELLQNLWDAQPEEPASGKLNTPAA